MMFTDRLNLFIKGLPLSGSPTPWLHQEVRERFLACLPEALQRLIARRHRALLLRADGERASAELVTGLEREKLGEIDVNHTTSLPFALNNENREQRHITELELPRDAVLTRSVSFPAQVRANLPQVIRYELDRLTPFQAEDVFFDYAPQAGPKNASRVNLDLVVCRRDLIDGWIKQMSALGSPLDRVTWEGAWPGANLLPPEQRPRSRRVRLGVGALLLLVAALLGVAVLLTPLWQKQQLAAMLDTELGEVRAQAVAVDDLRQELESARQGSTVVLRQKLERASTLDLLRDLTDRLPEDTWIQNLEISDGQVDLRGESGQATALIALLEQAPNIEGVSFKSPVTQVARTGKERFYLSLRYIRQDTQ